MIKSKFNNNFPESLAKLHFCLQINNNNKQKFPANITQQVGEEMITNHVFISFIFAIKMATNIILFIINKSI